MALADIRVPQLGEGLQEARIVRLMKDPGDLINQDEPIFEMETDKAVMEIESPVSGRLVRWTAESGDVVDIGTVIGLVETDASIEPVTDIQSSHSVIADVRVPQLGEGLQEARIIRFHKQPGDMVARDEVLYEMETDKAVMEIESPYSGTLVEWVVLENDVVDIGAVVARISGSDLDDGFPQQLDQTEDLDALVETAESAKVSKPAGADGPLRNRAVPPRTRAYAVAKGLSEIELNRLVEAVGGRILPEHVDAWLSDSGPTKMRSLGDVLHPYSDIPLPPRQKSLNYHMQRSAQSVVSATMEMHIHWDRIEIARKVLKAQMGADAPSQFVLFAWCVAQSMKENTAFRSALLRDDSVRIYQHLNLGIAVTRPNDELLIARIDNADTLDLAAFAAAARLSIRRAREGQDQASDTMQLSITSMAGAGITFGIPIVVAPAAGTLFIGAPFDVAERSEDGGIKLVRKASMVFTFDHRLANGVGAARFLSEIRERVESIDERIAAMG